MNSLVKMRNWLENFLWLLLLEIMRLRFAQVGTGFFSGVECLGIVAGEVYQQCGCLCTSRIADAHALALY